MSVAGDAPPPSPSSFGQTVDQAIGGARGVKCMLWETSLLDADEGIRFRGHTIPDLQKSLPTYSGKQEDEPLPEALIWLLLTGEVPTAAQTQELTDDLHKRAQLPAHVEPMIRAFPDNMHPMTQLSAAILACQTESQFAKAYSEGASKMDYWETTLEDSLNLMAQLPEIAALIYRCKFHDGKVAAYDASLDYSANFCRMLGYNDPKFDELMRLYLGKCDGSGDYHHLTSHHQGLGWYCCLTLLLLLLCAPVFCVLFSFTSHSFRPRRWQRLRPRDTFGGQYLVRPLLVGVRWHERFGG